MFIWESFDNDWDMLLLEIAKRKKTQIVTAHKIFMKTHIVEQTKHQFCDKISIETLIFELKGFGWDLSVTRISDKLTKRTKITNKF